MSLKLISPLDFAEWLRTSKRGDRLSYYLGFLCHDRSNERTMPNGQKVTITNPDIDKLAAIIWEAYENRKVLLVQAKVTMHVYDYIAVRT